MNRRREGHRDEREREGGGGENARVGGGGATLKKIDKASTTPFPYSFKDQTISVK